MKKRTALIGALVSLLPLGEPLVFGTSAVLTSTVAMLTVTEKVKAESADFYYKRGIALGALGDTQGEIDNYSKAIEINPNYSNPYFNRGIAKENIGDINGACSDWRKAVSLGYENAAEFVRNQC